MEPERNDIKDVFDVFDTDKKGYLTLNQFEKLGESMNLSTPDVQEIFNSLDANKDGLVEQQEFVNSFNSLTALPQEESTTPSGLETPDILVTEEETDYGKHFENTGNSSDKEKHEDRHREQMMNLDTPTTHRRRTSTPRTSVLRSRSCHESRRKSRRYSPAIVDMSDGDTVYTANRGTWVTFAESLGEEFLALSSYDKVGQVHKALESTESEELLRSYESMVKGVVKELTKARREISEMETLFEKAKETSDQQLARLEEEMEHQISKEKELRSKERKRADEESGILKTQFEQQIEQLEGAIRKLKQSDEKLTTTLLYEQELDLVREKVRKLDQENLSLKNKLTEATTNMALLQNSIREMEVANQEKALEYISKRDEEEAQRVKEERDRISREVESLQSNNQKLMDSNDNLREALEKTLKRASIRHVPKGVPPLEFVNGIDSLRSGQSSRASVRDMDALADCDPGRLPFSPHEFHNGVGVTRSDFNDSETERLYEASHRETRRHRSSRVRRNPSNTSGTSGTSRRTRSKRGHSRGFQLSGDEFNPSDVTDDELMNISISSTVSSESRSRQSTRSGRMTPDPTRKIITPDLSLSYNKRMYKIVLCGDSGVGKTSFIFKVCRNEFHRPTKTTLGVDFQITTVEVEQNKSIALQLWDTAGQERFRSISASYFRRAEGVLLLYDCTNQISFINVRDWMETIVAAVHEGTPIMICGHKVDLREEQELNDKPVVTTQEGAQLAASYGVLFVETSALDGSNARNAVVMLARHIKPDDDTSDAASVKQLGVTSEKRRPCCNQS